MLFASDIDPRGEKQIIQTWNLYLELDLALHGIAGQRYPRQVGNCLPQKCFFVLGIPRIDVTTSKKVTGIRPNTHLNALLNAASES
ncbi:MAG: hypothetical protein ACRYFU_21570 [Janthinobacterium lividum]